MVAIGKPPPPNCRNRMYTASSRYLHSALTVQYLTEEACMGNIVAGAVLIGIGLAMGGSVFRGDFSLTSVFFDGLGSFWIAKGLYEMYKARSS